jgi:hypothetical protein
LLVPFRIRLEGRDHLLLLRQEHEGDRSRRHESGGEKEKGHVAGRIQDGCLLKENTLPRAFPGERGSGT